MTFAAVWQLSAVVIDLGGSTQYITDIATADYGGVYFRSNTVVNGILEVTGNQSFSKAPYTFGSNLVINQTHGRWTVSGNRQVHVVDGGVVNLNRDSTTNFFGRSYVNGGWYSYNDPTSLVLDNGTLNSVSSLYFSPIANNNSSAKNVELNLLMVNGSSLSLTGDGNNALKFGAVDCSNGKKHTTEKVTVAVTNSTISVGSIHFGNNNEYLTSQESSWINASFGPGADITCQQFYVYQYPKATISFDGATVHMASGYLVSFFGRNGNAAATFAGYQLRSGGLTFDVTSDFSHGSLYAPLFGPGGFTKTGSGSLTYDVDAFMFTGPLTVSNGTFISTQKMAASAFNVDGASSVLQLSGALTNATVSLSATAGGTLTLAGAAISDASPDLTLAGGGTTDYFTRDGAVGAYALDSLTLGPGAVIDLDADATAVDAIVAAATSITATAESKVTVNVNFTEEPAGGQSFTLFEADSADKFTVVPKLGSRTLRHKESVVDGRLVTTVVSVGLVITVM